MMHIDHDDCCNNNMNEHDNAQESQVSAQEQEIVACKEKLAKAQEKYIYLNADFENFRRNTVKERGQWARMAQTRIFEGLVDIVDDLSRALEDFNTVTDVTDQEKARFQGVELTYKNFLRFLELHEVSIIPTDGAFNPQLHEALMQVEVEGKAPDQIVAVLQKGYMHKDVVIRPAKVSVSR